MISVQLKALTNIDITTLSSYAAKICYTADVPELGQLIQVKERLFTPGHHTTIEHNHFTFLLNGLSVSSVLFGIHLNAPYYNSDQRSGRFSKMYDNPDIESIREYLHSFYPTEDIDSAICFIQKGVDIYQRHIRSLTDLSAQIIRRDRPFATEKYIEQNAKKFAQEQLRVFISQVTPTALVTTVNTSALAALWRVAWSPEMRQITDKMRDAVLSVQPDIAYMFDETKRTGQDWFPRLEQKIATIRTEPVCTLLAADPGTEVIPSMKDSVDLLPFSPFAMNNQIRTIHTQIEVSCGTMGEDQRHRSIHRGEPVITGAFYVPPLLAMAGLQETARNYMQDYLDLSDKLSPALMTTIMPYGAMARYEKQATVNALLHEQGKRLCWCAQEEISEIARQLRAALKQKHLSLGDKLAPPCYTGSCHEGVRFCGRQTRRDLVAEYFPKRTV